MGFDKLAWIDVESTGLHPKNGHQLLQVACLVTDNNLNILDEVGYEGVILHEDPEAVKALAIEYVQDMHTKTGLWERLPEGKPTSVIDAELLSYIKQFQAEPMKSWFGGNSIKLDRDFAEEFFPQTYAHIHYRSVDVTSIAGLGEAWYGVRYEKKGTHDAKDDIRESIEELRFYKETIFK